ncbi:MAG TPA: hypothetical protein VHT91_27500 [Kofleriaceae bacterium]|jgi:hypothetical protein|nr:hypothetical protein [Kofleriaceae bacterium]
MLRAILCAVLVLTACRKQIDPEPEHPQEAPPLPPASGTPVGYLVDNAGQLNLREDQLAKLQDIDRSLSARVDDIETQIRIIEKPAEDPEAAPGSPPPRHNNAPGAQVKSTPDAAKLREARKSADDDALRKAFAILDPAQQTAARKLLEDHGFTPPADARPARREPADGAPAKP